jgi:hypothetical protein
MPVDPQKGEIFRILLNHFVLSELYAKRNLLPSQYTDSTLFHAFFSPALLTVNEIGENMAKSTNFLKIRVFLYVTPFGKVVTCVSKTRRFF